MYAPTERTAIVAAEGMPRAALIAACVVVVVSLVVLLVELRRAHATGRGRRVAPLLTGAVAAAALLLAIVRPHRLRAKELNVAPRTLIVLDRSRSMALSSDASPTGRPRIDVAEEAVAALVARLGGRVDVTAFGLPSSPGAELGDPLAAPSTDSHAADGSKPAPTSALERAPGAGRDLGETLRALTERATDPIGQIIVVSDGRVDIGAVRGRAGLPKIHAVAIGEASPPDAAIRSVHFVGAAVAHQPTPLRVEVACTGGLACGDLTVTVRELREAATEEAPRAPSSRFDPRASPASTDALLATGTAAMRDGVATLELPITLERAGTRAIEVALSAPSGDALPDNDHRLLTVDVARERVRILHIAGRPTFDVRALRTWLKSDAAIDVVSFFILRTQGDDVKAGDSELALIPFPVRELFTEFLPTFDAVIFQDFDAEPYGMSAYMPNLARYVEHGGGLVHVGGVHAFSAGGYAGSPLARVTPVEMLERARSGSGGATGHDEGRADSNADTTPFVPNWTSQAKSAPILADLATVLGDELPSFPGTSVLGDVREGAIALWVHPTRKTASGAPMPVLAVGDVGDGRSIALGLDATRILAFSEAAVSHGGRGYDALWRGLIGWLMRDPRYEAVRARLVYDAPTFRGSDARALADSSGGRSAGSAFQACMAGAPAAVVVDAAPIDSNAVLHASFRAVAPPEMRPGEAILGELQAPLPGPPPQRVSAGKPPAGAYAMRIAISQRGDHGDPHDTRAVLGALATRTIAVCERGGEEWADPRPDRATLEALTQQTGGVLTQADRVSLIPSARADVITLERTLTPILPAWAWAALAAVAMGVHWIARRRAGLA